MDFVNENTITKILSTIEPNTEITAPKWNLEQNVLKPGENFMCELVRLTLVYEKDGKPVHKSVFVKVAFNSPAYKIGLKLKAFDKETVMYNEILPQIYNFEQNPFTPKLYYEDDNYTFYLEDLSHSGYRTANRVTQLNFEHCVYALKCLAKFHGLSVKLEKNSGIPQIFKKHAILYRDGLDDNIKNLITTGLDSLIENLPPEFKKKYAKKIEWCKTNVINDLSKESSLQNDTFKVLNHGDYWTNNIMFKYDQYGIIKKVKMVDFQMCTWGSPAFDLIRFTIECMQFEVFERYYDLLLEIYLDTLNKILSKLDCGVYEMAQLKKDINSKYYSWITSIVVALPVIISVPEDTVYKKQDLSKNLDFATTCSFQKKYLDLAQKWLLYLLEKSRLFPD